MPLTQPIAIITDFGNLDPYVGMMKGVISKIAPGVQTIDITHKIPPGAVRHAAINLWRACAYFPDGTVFLIVVDPGVGTSRRGIFVDNGRQIFIGPDNGVFSYIFGSSFTCWELTNREFQLEELSTTFHGRDIFSPAAAYASRGVSGSRFGAQLNDLVRLPAPLLQVSDKLLKGEILLSDHFGNLLTSLGLFVNTDLSKYMLTPWLEPKPDNQEKTVIDADHAQLVLQDERSLRWFKTFAEIPQGICGVLVGSSGLLEIAANGDSAAKILGLVEGEELSLKF